eukprot:1192400-Prorocentrum_minimum.AAC.4
MSRRPKQAARYYNHTYLGPSFSFALDFQLSTLIALINAVTFDAITFGFRKTYPFCLALLICLFPPRVRPLRQNGTQQGPVVKALERQIPVVKQSEKALERQSAKEGQRGSKRVKEGQRGSKRVKEGQDIPSDQ